MLPRPTAPPVLLNALRGLNFGPSLSYDVAQSGATSTNVLQPGGQVAQVVSQVNLGNVTLAFISASDNDTSGSLTSIANGSLSGAALTSAENSLAANVEAAVTAVLNAGGKVVLSGYSNLVDAPLAASIYADPTMKARAEGAISAIDTQLLNFANANGVPFINLFELEKSVFDSGSLVVGGVNINLFQFGPDPHNFYKSSIAAGTVIRAEVANLWMEAMNRGFGTNLTLFTDQDILNLAGIGNEYNGVESFSTASNLSQFATPEPSSFTLLAAGISIATVCRVRQARRRSRR